MKKPNEGFREFILATCRAMPPMSDQIISARIFYPAFIGEPWMPPLLPDIADIHEALRRCAVGLGAGFNIDHRKLDTPEVIIRRLF